MLIKLLITSSLLILTSCNEHYCEPTPPKIVKVPVKCQVPKSNCKKIDDNATNIEVIVKLLECISLKNNALKVCDNNTTKVDINDTKIN